MKLNLINADLSIVSGDTPLAHGNIMVGAVYAHGGKDYVVVAKTQDAREINAIETSPMVLDGTNFTIS